LINFIEKKIAKYMKLHFKTNLMVLN
jgi:hypothetical protein